jgi:DNA (cytosine-5)-methyltransferase 1
MRDIDGEWVSRTELRFDGIAGCLRVSTGGSSRQFVVVIENGWVRSRLLSPRRPPF